MIDNTWTKVTPRQNNGRGRAPGADFKVKKYKYQGYTECWLSVPEAVAIPSKFSVFERNDTLAFVFDDDGEYTVKKPKNWKAASVTIPAGFADRIPLGTTVAEVRQENGVLFLDLAQFDQENGK